MTQGERQDYKWRPNDNSSTTRLRYDLEAEHWYRSFKNAERKNKPSSKGNDLGVIGLILGLILNLILLFVLLITNLIKYLKKN